MCCQSVIMHSLRGTVFVVIFSCRGHEWSTFVCQQWMSVAWYVESVVPPSERLIYYISEAQRTIDSADDDSFIACLSALLVLLPKVVKILFSNLWMLCMSWH